MEELRNTKGSICVKMRWAISGKQKSERLLLELSWFIDKLHALAPTSGQQLHQVMVSTQTVEVSGALQLPESVVSDEDNSTHLASTSISRVVQCHMEHPRLESTIRRTRLKHAC